MSDAAPSKMQRAVPGVVSLAVTVPVIMRHRHDVAALWPEWQSLIEMLLLVLAGCAALAAVVVGVQAWRGAGVHD